MYFEVVYDQCCCDGFVVFMLDCCVDWDYFVDYCFGGIYVV